jgi:hypothetical protein
VIGDHTRCSAWSGARRTAGVHCIVNEVFSPRAESLRLLFFLQLFNLLQVIRAVRRHALYETADSHILLILGMKCGLLQIGCFESLQQSNVLMAIQPVRRD